MATCGTPNCAGNPAHSPSYNGYCLTCNGEAADYSPTCDQCGEEFVENGPGSRSRCDDSVCEYCYANPEEED